MPDTRSPDDVVQADEMPLVTPGSLIRRRRGLRIALVSLASVAVLLGAVVAGAYAYVNHAVSSIQRIPVSFLAKVGPSGAMTILLTSSDVGPTGAGSASQTSGQAGLVMLLHLNAGGRAGGVASIPPEVVVNVPGYGQTELMDATALGGPSLLTETVTDLTGVPVNHYARIDFSHVASVIDAMGGVWITVPQSEVAFGHAFHRGRNYVNGTEAVEYTRDPSVSQDRRVLRQGSLIRAVLDKLASENLATNPGVLNTASAMLTVDSTFTNSDIESLATRLGSMSSSMGTFVAAPTSFIRGSEVLNARVSRKLWAAINHDRIASFARQYPWTAVPYAP